jgi:hypothetical protein
MHQLSLALQAVAQEAAQEAEGSTVHGMDLTFCLRSSGSRGTSKESRRRTTAESKGDPLPAATPPYSHINYASCRGSAVTDTTETLSLLLAGMMPVLFSASRYLI